MKIKNFSIVILMLIGVLAFTGCKKDPCETITCQNGGTCNNGTCNCPSGYTGKFCETPPDPCASVTCLNGGTCANGNCICTQGYTGTNCGTEITPTTITLSKVVMDQFPPLDNGSDWDGALCGGANPDIKIKLWDDGNSIYIWTSGIYTDCIPGTSYTYTLGLPITINNPTGSYGVDLFDNDTGGCSPDDFMGFVNFIPYQSGQSFPSTIKVFDSVKKIDVTLHVTYTW